MFYRIRYHFRRRTHSRRSYLAKREVARALVISRLNHYQNIYSTLKPELAQSLQYRRLAIRNTRSRWGSCSSRKNLNFNYRIIELSPALQDYIIVHELCHLVEFNHSQAFWDLVGVAIPDYRQQKATLRHAVSYS